MTYLTETKVILDMFWNNKLEEDIIKYLNENLDKIDIQARCYYGNTLLILAGNRKYSKLVTKLINLGVDIHAENIHGKTIFSSLTADGDVENLKLLFENGAVINVNKKRDSGFLYEMVYYQRLDATILVINHLATSNNSKYKLKLLMKTLEQRLEEVKVNDSKSYIEKTENYVNTSKKEIKKHLSYLE